MRIIGGEFAGKLFDSPRGHRTHPMSEKIRGAIFNTLGDVEGLTLLDAFAGSGAIAIEAVSRGAASAVAIDIDTDASKTISKNIALLGIQNNIKVVRANAGSWSDNNLEIQFDLVVCDPPYNDVRPSLIEKLAGHVRPGGLLICSLPPSIELEQFPGFHLITRKNYGDATVVYFRRIP